MNNYPSWWNTTITIFNKYENPLTNLVTWYKTVITGCFWKNVHEKVKLGSMIVETDNVICRIRKDARYLDKETWLNKPADKKANFFTIGREDIVVQGEVSDTINEYSAGSRSTDLLSKYKALDKCLQVEHFSDNTGGGRGNEHYYIKGI